MTEYAVGDKIGVSAVGRVTAVYSDRLEYRVNDKEWGVTLNDAVVTILEKAKPKVGDEVDYEVTYPEGTVVGHDAVGKPYVYTSRGWVNTTNGMVDRWPSFTRKILFIPGE